MNRPAFGAIPCRDCLRMRAGESAFLAVDGNQPIPCRCSFAECEMGLKNEEEADEVENDDEPKVAPAPERPRGRQRAKAHRDRHWKVLNDAINEIERMAKELRDLLVV